MKKIQAETLKRLCLGGLALACIGAVLLAVKLTGVLEPKEEPKFRAMVYGTETGLCLFELGHEVGLTGEYWCSLTDDCEILWQGKACSREDLEIGDVVDVYFAGGVEESYPAGIHAHRLEVVNEDFPEQRRTVGGRITSVVGGTIYVAGLPENGTDLQGEFALEVTEETLVKYTPGNLMPREWLEAGDRVNIVFSGDITEDAVPVLQDVVCVHALDKKLNAG